MRIGPTRLLAVAAAVVALAAPAVSHAAMRLGAGDRGVVQSIDAQHVVLRALDGTQVSFTLFPGTQVKVDGVRATTADVQRGVVADVVADAKGRALVIRAFSGSGVLVDRGVVTAVTKTSLTLVPDGGGVPIVVPLDRTTKLKQAGVIVRKPSLRPGMAVSVTHTADGPALVVTILKRAGA